MLPATGSLASTSASTQHASSAGAASAAVVYHGQAGSAKRATQAASVSRLPGVASAFRNQGPLVFAPISGRRASAVAGRDVGAGQVAAPQAGTATAGTAASGATAKGGHGSGVVHGFNGVSNLDSDAINGTPVTPPDQGLCVGRDTTLAGAPKAVWEPVNIAARETSPAGARLRPDVNLATLFQDPFAEGDVRCLYGLDPAIGTGSGTGYLVNSFPFLANGDNNPVASQVGAWTLRDTSAVTSGYGTPTLTGRATPSEPYAFPVPATSTGDGSTSTVTDSDGTFTVTSETALQADDSRMIGPVEVTYGHGGAQLWTALDAAVTSHGNATDAAAWFAIDPNRARVTSQGYVTAKNANLLYPAIQPQRDGPPAVVFTITSKTINPSAAYTTLGSSKITTVAAGAGPHLSFSDAPPYNESRWGDYSFTALDPDGSGVWLATEYIPPASDQDPADNWGTYVVEVNGR
jgi:hypothetical protein